MTPSLSRELGRLLSLGDARLDERQALQEAIKVQAVDKLDDLKGTGRQLVKTLRSRAAGIASELRSGA